MCACRPRRRPLVPERLFSCVFAAAAKRGQLQTVAAKKDKKGKLMWEALREAVDEEMEQDPNVCVIGMIHSDP